MGFQGNATQIPLTNILQALLLNGQEGMLVVGTKSFEARLGVLPSGLRPLNSSANKADLLRRFLIKLKLFTAPQLDSILSGWSPRAGTAGDFLIRKGLLDPEAIAERLQRQVEDFVLELLTTQDLGYEFVTSESPAAYELFDPSGLGNFFLLNGNAVLMEAARREDELTRIRALIPSSKTMFVAVNPRQIANHATANKDPSIREIIPYLTSGTSVDQLSRDTSLSNFECFEVLGNLLSKKLVRKLSRREMLRLAESFSKTSRGSNAALIYEGLLLDVPDDFETRTALVSILEALPDQAASLPQHYLRLSESLATRDPDRARAYASKALSQDPTCIEAMQALFNQYRRAGQHRDAVGVTQSTAVAVKQGGSPLAGREFLELAIGFYPEEPAIFRELAAIQELSGDRERATESLKAAAEIHARRNEPAKVRRLIDDIKQLAPAEALLTARRLLPSRRGKVRPGRLLKLTLISTLSGVALAMALILGTTDYHARRVYAQLLQDVSTARSVGNIGLAKLSVEDFGREYPFSTRTKAALDLSAELNREFLQQTEEMARSVEGRRIAANSDLSQAQILVQQKDYVKAFQLLKGMDLEVLDDAKKEQAIKATKYLKAYFAEAAQLQQRSDRAAELKDFELCYTLRRQLLTRYPAAAEAKSLTLPIRIETVPDGARASIESRVLGYSPLVVEVPINSPAKITLSKSTYEDKLIPFDPATGETIDLTVGHTIRIALKKLALWSHGTEASIEAFPATVGRNVCVGTRNGRVLCFSQDLGNLVWTFSIPDNMDIAGGIGSWSNLVYFGSFDGRLYVLDADSGRPALPPFAPTPDFAPIKVPPSVASKNGLVAIVSNRRTVSTFNLASGKAGWSIPFQNLQVIGQPVLHEGNLFILLSNGDLLELNHETGALIAKHNLGFEPTANGVVSPQGLYYVGSPAGTLLCLDLYASKPRWSHECAAAILSPPTVDEALVVVPLADGTVHAFTMDGDPVWSFQSQESFPKDAQGLMTAKHFLIGTNLGSILCVSRDKGALIWSYKADARGREEKAILSRGAVKDDRFFIGTEGAYFYAFSLD